MMRLVSTQIAAVIAVLSLACRKDPDPTHFHLGDFSTSPALAETLKAGKLGLAMIVKQVQSVDIAVAAKSCGYDAINVDLEHSVIPLLLDDGPLPGVDR